jgi:hypothetical protein
VRAPADVCDDAVTGFKAVFHDLPAGVLNALECDAKRVDSPPHTGGDQGGFQECSEKASHGRGAVQKHCSSREQSIRLRPNLQLVTRLVSVVVYKPLVEVS